MNKILQKAFTLLIAFVLFFAAFPAVNVYAKTASYTVKFRAGDVNIIQTERLDKEVFELARRIPTRYRADRDHTKIAMRGAAMRKIPPKTADKKKLGFPVPVRAWLRDERYASIVREKLTGETAALFFRTDRLATLLDQHLSGKRDNWRQIWCVFIFLVWYDEYFVKR